MDKTTLVLGAGGIVGRRLVPLLRARGQAVRAASRSAGAADAAFDWQLPDTFDRALEGVGAIYLVPPAMVEDASAAVADLLERARRAGVARVVAVSSLGVTFPTEPPMSGRRRFEDAVTASGLAWTLLRPSGFMQNFSEGFMLPAILQAGVIASAAGDGAVALVDAADIAGVALTALTAEGHAERAYAVTGPAPLTFAQAALAIGEAAGRPIGYRAVPEAAMAEMMSGAGVPPDYAAMLLRDQRAVREGSAAAVASTVHDLTGRTPNTFAEYARDAADSWRRGATG